MKTALKLFVISAITLAHVGCTSLVPATLKQDCANGETCAMPVVVGDNIEVQTTDNRTLKLKVTQVSDLGLVGDATDTTATSVGVPARDITHLEKREFAKGRTVLLAAGIAVVVGVAITAMATTSMAKAAVSAIAL